MREPQCFNAVKKIMQFVSEGDLCDRIPLKRGLPEVDFSSGLILSYVVVDTAIFAPNLCLFRRSLAAFLPKSYWQWSICTLTSWFTLT